MNLRIFTSIAPLIFISLTCTAGEWLDVETLPLHRSQRYETPYDKIVIFTEPRTGSSLIYNVFRFLFEKEDKIFSHHTENDPDKITLKVHEFKPEELFAPKKVLYVMTVRNPVDTCISHYRIFADTITNFQGFIERQITGQHNYLTCYEKMVQKGLNTLLFQYEYFNQDIDYLLELIENYFQLSIYKADKELLRRGLSKQNVSRCTENLNSFFEYLPCSGFHGKHVASNNYEPPDEIYFWINTYLVQVRHLYEYYGY